MARVRLHLVVIRLFSAILMIYNLPPKTRRVRAHKQFLQSLSFWHPGNLRRSSMYKSVTLLALIGIVFMFLAGCGETPAPQEQKKAAAPAPAAKKEEPPAP